MSYAAGQQSLYHPGGEFGSEYCEGSVQLWAELLGHYALPCSVPNFAADTGVADHWRLSAALIPCSPS